MPAEPKVEGEEAPQHVEPLDPLQWHDVHCEPALTQGVAHRALLAVCDAASGAQCRAGALPRPRGAGQTGPENGFT